MIIGIITIIIVALVVILVFVVKSKKKNDENSENDPINPYIPEPAWDNLIPTFSEEEIQELIQASYNITTSMTQSEIQEILSNNLYQIIHFHNLIFVF